MRARLKQVCAIGGVALGLVITLPLGWAQADTPINSFSAVPSTRQAGGHPDVEVQFSLENRLLQKSQSACNCEDAKNATVHLPTGFIGNPHATPQCSIADFSADRCPVDSQVGVVSVNASAGNFISMLYNLVPPPDQAGLLGFKVFLFNTPQFTVLSARTGSDYGLDASAISIYHGTFPLQTFQEDLWGVPAEPKHDPLRLDVKENRGFSWYGDTLCDANGTPSTDDPNTIVMPCGSKLPPVASNSPLTPFLQNPTNCDSALESSLEVLSYDGGLTEADHAWPQPTGCDQLSFNPSLYAQPTTTETDTASGIDIDLKVPQELSPTIPSPTELRGATVTLPPGFTINPNAADGKTACADQEARFGSEEEGHCPEFAKIGSLEIESSALPGPLPGYVYLGQPLPGNRYRIFLIADGFATHIKLAGTVTPDPTSGQLVITFDDLPESPLTAFNMHLFGSERGLLATPTQCGSYPVTTRFRPWDSSLGTQTSTQFFTLDSGPNEDPCPGPTRPFTPTVSTGVTDSTAGAHTQFLLDLQRSDGNQDLSSLSVTTPPGFAATLAGIPYCSEASISAAANPNASGLAEQANPSCSPAAEVGSATTAVGAGNHPLYVPGKVYLAGPYRGAPLSLAVITPAISGPYDLGNVVVRVALHVNPTNAQITAVSDPLPRILDGIPLRIRGVVIQLNRPGFALNPTNCNPLSVGVLAAGDQAGQASFSSPFQVNDCTDLSFGPKLSLRLSGSTRRTAAPALHSLLTASAGEAGISRAVVTMPPSEIVDNAHIGNVCSQAQFHGSGCPPDSVIGFARATTPLLEKPLEGPVYLMSGLGHRLPDVVADLKGQIEIVLDGRVDSVNGGIRTSFETVPDAPVSSFSLNLDGGRKGLLQNSEPICSHPLKATIALVGQNGRSADSRTQVQTPCGRKSASHRRRNRRIRPDRTSRRRLGKASQR